MGYETGVRIGRFISAIKQIDATNGEDPNVEMVDGFPEPKELVYSRRMSAWLARLHPEASEALQLAVRCQHIQRWKIPRSDYPMDRTGYLRWRTDLKRFHAEVAATILRDCGYDAATIASVETVIRKEGLRVNPNTQALEDCACLVFLEHPFVDFAQAHDREKVIAIVRKTWAKMSEAARAAALGLELPGSAASIVQEALGA